jgi:hypothetical protein
VDLEGCISVLGENGTVEVGGFAMNEMTVWKFADETPEDGQVLERYRTNPPDVYGFGHHEYYRDVFNAIAKDEPPFVDGLEGRKSLEVITAIYESIESGREVRFPFTPTHSRLGRRGGTEHDPLSRVTVTPEMKQAILTWWIPGGSSWAGQGVREGVRAYIGTAQRSRCPRARRPSSLPCRRSVSSRETRSSCRP